ncbi:MAG TPA: type II toxin-antitoxin system PrlF family antitoxin [Wenzhouxiangella sp.]
MSEPIDKPGEVQDPVIKVFLDFLAKDMANHPEQLQVISASLAKRLQSLADDVVDDVVDDVAVDLDAPLSPDDE